MIERLALGALARIDSETAHGLALKALHTPFAPSPGPITSPVLKTNIAGLELPNPVGLAAGFDKNATALAPLMQAGFGFLEVGAATPRPQPGNAKPRLFRLSEDRAVINRFGFNNDGVEAIAERLAARPAGIPVGLNLGANKDSADRAKDFAEVLVRVRDHVDFATVNVSSPNTEKLRDLQGPDALAALLDGVMAVRGDVPVFLKIAPDLSDAEIADIAGVAQKAGVHAIIATNTTLARPGLTSPHRDETGGLSGRPLFGPSTRVLARLYRETGGAIPLIGVGGVESASEAYAKIRAGASAVQLYSAMVYWGLSLVARIARGLDERLQHDGFHSVADAVGTGVDDWL
ncbi:quinone-dependent dihydroorotate dehydrogenase [Alphaproteobacteria bacterium GH1-50]|uniref:Dihydroorotate dehydrogenase (quinone) n=1 Tax=Kangsaoukella pontilimi TaxID=2691042 RepID=A0A7C9IJ01_9RHOB|nr:quinone-dependent dihydroorotate dehydrogenase [Kangsaoukella pontilimi]MXQ09607.1 quinone-dependent dihydroorotate dehydrogenase [Kangsaoukella pontilimi]